MLKLSHQTLLTLFIAGFSLAILSLIFLDNTVYGLVHPAFASQRPLWEQITYIGDSEWMAIASLAAILIGLAVSRLTDNPLGPRLWRSGLFAFICVAIVGLSGSLLKNMIGRARPYLYDTEGPHSFIPFGFDPSHAAFPSGHTTTAFALTTVLVILFPRLAIPAFSLAALAGFSRMAVDAHYLGDVIGGATYGVIGTILVGKWLAPKLKIS
ncbi:MAG: phosphatase PAP2 family protein [Rhodobacteraceae bacterium]|nr:phosphatase PAP2 family protein [Paracoccaceae bacterium]